MSVRVQRVCVCVCTACVCVLFAATMFCAFIKKLLRNESCTLAFQILDASRVILCGNILSATFQNLIFCIMNMSEARTTL